MVVFALRFLKPGLQAPGITTVVTVIVFFSGIQLLLMGLLGEYVGAIHSQTRRKPFVIVKEAMNVDPDVLAKRSPRTPLALPPVRESSPSASPAQTIGRAVVFGGDTRLSGAIANLLEQRAYAVIRLEPTVDELVRLAGPLSVVAWAASSVDDVARTLEALLEGTRLAPNAALCVVGPVEQDRTRTGKLSHSIAEAALSGLVRGAARDLAPRIARINAVVPGGQVSVDEVANVVTMLVSPELAAVTGQSIVVDGGQPARAS